MPSTDPTRESTTTSTEEEEVQVPEYKVGEKKTIDEYANLDAEDESLKKWKESLGLAGGSIGAPDDKRKVVLLELSLHIDGEKPQVFNMEDPTMVEKLKKVPFILKEKSKYHLHIKFRVQHDIVTGLKYTQVARRAGIRASKIEDICGSYPPNTKEKPFYEKDIAEGEAPSGFLARGSYTALSTFSDDDNVVHKEVPWLFEIKK